MVFTSFNFLIFYILLIALYYTVPAKYRMFILFLGSYFFYMNIKPVFAFLLAGVSISTYFIALLIDRTKEDSRKRTYLFTGITLVLLPLFFYKYFGAINSQLYTILKNFNLEYPITKISLILPVGISFYTFTAISYIIDVYNEEIEPEKNFGVLVLFISFFPLILSGPIERAKNMLPQYRNLSGFNYNLAVQGMKYMLWGYFMKLVVADRIGIYVDAIFNNISQHNGTTFLVASILYPFQVYADLGGYSLIAIGTANVLGIHVIQNFKRPFFATSMAEFWRRWHISLISWLTDYVYTPLSFTFRKYKIWGIVLALMVTFLISGIWHGAGMTFIVWGLMQGTFLSLEALTSKRRALIRNKFNLNNNIFNILTIIFGTGYTFILFAVSEIIDKAVNLHDAMIIYTKIFTNTGPVFIGTPKQLIFIAIGLSMLLIKDFTNEYAPSGFQFYNNKRQSVRIFSYVSTSIIILLIGVFDGGQFIYFQF